MGCCMSRPQVIEEPQSEPLSEVKTYQDAAATILYGGDPLYINDQNQRSKIITQVSSSGFTTVILFALHIQDEPNGTVSIVFNEGSNCLIENSQYVGDSTWPEALQTLKGSTSAVNRLLFCIGGWNTGDFSKIQTLLATTQGYTALYNAFSALKQAIPCVDGIDLDDENLYDQSTTVGFSKMLSQIGYQITFCPFTNQDFWVNCLYALNKDSPDGSGPVTGFNLQCYSGGAGNVTQVPEWIDAVYAAMNQKGKFPNFPAKEFVFPGLNTQFTTSNGLEQPGPPSINSQFSLWASNGTGIVGGFIWRLGLALSEQPPLYSYSIAITNGLKIEL